ncbi:MAG: hypothetical protein AB7O66_24680 [Limisphaerales bacterium]
MNRSFEMIRIVGALSKRTASEMEGWRCQELSAEFKTVRRGSCMGDETFRRELLVRMSGCVWAHRRGALRVGTQ